jgi:drug/metabolite transporter (DMT)-like permease
MKEDILLLITAAIWGFAFVAQRAGMRLIGPLTYNGVRFSLGLVSLLPLLVLQRRKSRADAASGENYRKTLSSALITGLFLCAACAFQQMGLVFTTAGKAGFITSLYVVLVPVFGIFLGTKSGPGGWLGAVLAVSGLYLLSIQGGFSVNTGDIFVLVSSLFFAGHTILVARNSFRFHPLVFSFIQYALCAVLSLAAALCGEEINPRAILSAWLPIVYGGVFSVGIAYSLQITALRKAHPTHASILLSLAGLFAAAGGFLILGERFSARELAGAALMLGGAILSQLTKSEK